MAVSALARPTEHLRLTPIDKEYPRVVKSPVKHAPLLYRKDIIY